MEVCVDSVASAENAEKGGAFRLELCSSLVEGGTTPSVGMLRVVKQGVKIPVFVMIRPRGGDFCYSETEFEVMKQDISVLKEEGADGFVFGILNMDGTVDVPRCKELINLVYPCSATFHRAIDLSSDLRKALNAVISAGFERVLTSGGESTALEGAPVISDMIKQAGGRIIIMPGGGITERNLTRILEMTGAKEFHCSARTTCPSLMTFQRSGVPMGSPLIPSEFELKVTDAARVQTLMSMALTFWDTHHGGHH